jgi:hypothetical protein
MNTARGEKSCDTVLKNDEDNEAKSLGKFVKYYILHRLYFEF